MAARSGARADGAVSTRARSRMPPFRIRRQAIGKSHGAELVEGAGVDVALEVDDLADRLPVVHPTPAIEFRFARQVEAELRIGVLQTQQVPALLLAHTQRHGFAA